MVGVLSSNTHDKSMEVVMTGFFVTGPLMAVKPDDLEMLAFRDRLKAERASIAAAGQIMDVPGDWEVAEPGKWGSDEWFADLKAKGKTYP